MKTFKHTVLAGALCGMLSSVFFTAQADDTTTSEYLYNLGTYMGFSLTSPASPPPAQLFRPDELSKNNVSAVLSAAASFPFLTDSASNITYVPSALSSFSPTYQVLTTLPSSADDGGYSVWSTFTTPSTKTISAIKDVDQESYSTDLHNQILSDLLRTVDYTYCTSDKTSDTWVSSNCEQLNIFDVWGSFLGAGELTSGSNVSYGSSLPSAANIVSKSYVDSFLPDLNSDNFLGPLMYNTSENGLTSATFSRGSQAANASAYVRILSSEFDPTSLASYNNYNNWLSALTSSANDTATKQAAFTTLATYLTAQRRATAVISMGLGPLIDSLRYRMVNTATNTSPAFEDYRMATYRLNPPSTAVTNEDGTTSTENEWLTNLKTASSDALLRELNVTLSQMQWQLYRSNQLMEKMLDVQATMLIIAGNQLRQGAQLEDISEGSDSEDSSTEE